MRSWFVTAKPTKYLSTALILIVAFAITACGSKNYDISNSSDRQAMIIDAQTALTNNDCATALTLLSQLYQSQYTNDQIRLAYASAQGCNIGIQLYSLIDSLIASDLSTTSAIFKTFVKLFPSKTATDSRFQSSNFATDALQSCLLPGAVVATTDSIYTTTVNPGSLLTRDITQDAQAYMVFIGMASIGTTLNRYGFNPSDDPAATAYAKTVNLPWTTKAAVQADAVTAACTLTSGLFDLIDGIQSVSRILTGSTASALSSINSQLSTLINTAATNACLADPTPYTAAQCTAAVARLRYRGACAEQGAASAAAAGVVVGVNAGW